MCKAIAMAESGFNPKACRFEPGWAYFFKPEEFAKTLLQTLETEKVQQATSYGAMQIMGAVARELGFKGYLSELSANPRTAIFYSIKKLQQIASKYEDPEWVISAYNCGTPKKSASGFTNQTYVDRVKNNLQRFYQKEK